MIVDDIMSTAVVTVEMDDSLKIVNDIFDKTTFHHILVIDSNKLVGVISDRDLLKSISPNIGTVRETVKDTATLNKKAHQIMTRNPITLLSNSEIYDAIKIFNNQTVSCIPIVDDDDKPVGIVSWRDIFKAIIKLKKKT
jgi:acetoin utilization protein AcuB